MAKAARQMPSDKEAAPAPQVERPPSPSTAEGAATVLCLGQSGPGSGTPLPTPESTPERNKKRKNPEEEGGEEKVAKREGVSVLPPVIYC